MATPIIIKVVTDDDGTLSASTDAEVVVGRRDLVGDTPYPYDGLLPTFQHQSNGRYVNSSGDPQNEPGAGEWLLVVRKKGRSLVAQKLTFTEKDGVLKAAAGWAEAGRETVTAATVSIVNFDQASGTTAAAGQSLITVKLLPAQRFVALGCRDHHGGTRFVLFAEGRRDQLFDEGKLNAGAIATLFNCLTNEVVVTVKGAKLAPTNWVVVHRAKAPETKFGIMDFYSELDRIGSSDPNSVVEAGIYGHAWHQGPIVQGSFDQSPELSTRDPADQDARPKDWYPDGPIALDLPSLPSAFAPKSRMVVWGCSHMVNVIAEMAEANRQTKAGTPRSSFYSVVLDTGTLHTTLDYTKRNVAEYVLSQRVGRFPEHGSAAGLCTYGGRMAQALNGVAEVFLATPGMGANFGNAKGPKQKNGVQRSYIAMHIVDDGENTAVRNFCQREYGSFYERDDHLYMNYTKFLGVTLTDPPWATDRFIKYVHEDFKSPFLRLPSGLEVTRQSGKLDDPIPFSQGGESGHLYVSQGTIAKSLQTRGSAKFLVLSLDPAFSVGVFVTLTGKTLLLERPTGSKTFGLPKNLPVALTMRIVFDPHYKRFDGDDGTPLTSNLLEQVVPKWFW